MKQLFILLFLFAQLGYTQEYTFVEKNELLADSFIGVDNYKNTYFIKDMTLHKQGNDGDFVYANFQLGQPTIIDIINPLKVMVFYESLNIVVFLDNKLAEIERINFNELQEFVNVSHAKNAGNNRLWIFNIDTQQIELYNYRNNSKVTVSQPFPGTLNAITSNFNYCYTLTDLKLRAFNIYGSILFEKPSEGVEIIIQLDDVLFLIKDKTLVSVPKSDEEVKTYKLPEITIKDLHLTQDFMYIYDGTNLHTYTLTQPKK
ncbi:hypothetical protein [Patiriisocius hiemis]|uniref:Uncharacterized protein n=1 Tax=Patiriisocius hiemis TaxID=3075604 RepID=A0ABU2YFN6_9FLAO|nr:hypothetical protein [Constantimarinum sp. W242]MDT0555868.1 hypothetical protein [Constantimarinum sp. W242]